MKVLQFLLRVGFSLVVAFIASFSAAVIFFDYSNYKENSDRAFLVIVPTLAIGFLLFQGFPVFWNWLRSRQVGLVIVFGMLALLGAASIVLPVAISRVYYMGWLALALAFLGLMLPAVPAAERLRISGSIWHYAIGAILSLIFTYFMIGFFSTVFQKTAYLVFYTFLLSLLGSVVGYYLVQRAAHSLHDGFLRDVLNILLALLLPAFWVLVFLLASQYSAMLAPGYFQVPDQVFGAFLTSALLGIVWGLPALKYFEARGWYQSLSQRRVFSFVKENLPGVYAGGAFFSINLVIARALNHPSFSINSIVFQADAGPWMSILGFPDGHDVNRAVHPLVLITLRPLVRLVGFIVSDKWYLAPIFTVALVSGTCVLMAWLFVKRATQKDTYAFLFAILLGSTTAHLLFGSLTETYVFGMASLIFFFLLIQADERRFSVLVPAGLLVFGITVTNIAQGIIGLFFKKFPFWRLVYYGVIVLTSAVSLTALVSVLYPHNQTFFFVPADMAFEGRFSKPIYQDSPSALVEKVAMVGRTMFLYGPVAPTPIADIARKNTDPVVDLKTFDFQTRDYSRYDGLAYVPLALWLILLVGALILFFKNVRSSPHVPLMLGLLGCVAFNFLLHMNYGTELLLYTPFWTYLLVFFVALAFAELAGHRWFEIVLTVFVVTLILNNAHFISTILGALAPYFAAT